MHIYLHIAVKFCLTLMVDGTKLVFFNMPLLFIVFLHVLSSHLLCINNASVFMPWMLEGSWCSRNYCECLDSNWPCKRAEKWGSTCFNEHWFAFQRIRKHFSSSKSVGESSTTKTGMQLATCLWDLLHFAYCLTICWIYTLPVGGGLLCTILHTSTIDSSSHKFPK